MTVVAIAAAALGVPAAVSATSAAWQGDIDTTVAASAGAWAPADTVVQAGNGQTSINSISWQLDDDDGEGFCATTTITGVSDTPQPWELTADLSKPPFNGISFENGDVYYQGSAQVTIKAENATTLDITGVSQAGQPYNAAYNNALITSSQTLPVTICTEQAPVPAVAAASDYDASVSDPVTTQSGDELQVCETLTVTGLVTDTVDDPFYYGWTADLDLRPAKQIVDAEGYRLDSISWSPYWPSQGDDYFFTTAQPSGDNKTVQDDYTITSGRQTVLRGTGSTALTACLAAYPQ